MRDILIVEDSRVQAALMRNRILALYPDVNVRIAADPFEAREAIAARSPDLMLLDIELPKMSGSQFLGFLMRSHPLPVVVVSATVEHGSEREAKLLELGSQRIIKKASGPEEFASFDKALTRAIDDILCMADDATSKLGRRHGHVYQDLSCDFPAVDLDKAIIAIGSSTGGPKALESVLSSLGKDAPPVFIAQHIPLRFVNSFIETLQHCTSLQVQLAIHGERAERNHIYIAPPSYNLRVQPGLRMEIEQPPVTCRFVPNVDVLFSSVAQLRSYSVAAALLTGMGDDGAKGMLELKNHNAFTIAQNEETCAVYGMPARAVELGAAVKILPLGEIGSTLLRWYSNVKATHSVLSTRNQLESTT